MAQAVIGIDPRIRARRAAVRREEGRRRLRFLLGAFGVVAVCVGAWGLTRTALLDLDHVRVEGVARGSAAEIHEAADVAAGVSLMDVDTSAIAGRVEALPWVESADVRRDWPGTIRIEVLERVAVAVIPAGEGLHALLDAAGVVIDVRPVAATSTLPLVAVDLAVAPGDVQPSAGPGLALVAALPADVSPWIERILVGDAAAPAAVRIDLIGAAAVEVGEIVHLDDKVEALRAVLAGVDLQCIATIDVTVADLATVTRDPACVASHSTGDATASDD